MQVIGAKRSLFLEATVAAMVFVLLLLCSASPGLAEPPPSIVWDVKYDSGIHDRPNDVAVDGNGNVYVTGFSYNGIRDYRTIKYDASGAELWNVTYDGGGRDEARGVAVDGAGNVYVTGLSSPCMGCPGDTNDYRTIKYDANGTELWNVTYDGGNIDEARDIAVDGAGNVYVTGLSSGSNWDFRTIKYDTNGAVLWNVTYDSGTNDAASDIAVDDAGNVYLSGYSSSSIDGTWYLRTIKYDMNGSVVWDVTYDSAIHDLGRSIAVDGVGNVYVAGVTNDGVTSDYRTIKYDANGTELWNVTFDNGGADRAWGVAVDMCGAVYVTGYSSNGTTNDLRTIKYDTNGLLMWNEAYDTGMKAGANLPLNGIAVDAAKNVYVTGSSIAPLENFRTLKLTQQPSPIPGIVVDKIQIPADPAIGDALTYQIVVTNTGSVTIENVVVVDTVSPVIMGVVTDAPAAFTALTPAQVAGGTRYEWSATGLNFQPGDVYTFTITGTVGSVSAPTTVNNAAWLSTGDVCNSGSIIMTNVTSFSLVPPAPPAPPVILPTVPSSLTAVGQTGQVSLSWSPANPGSSPISAYEIYRATCATCASSLIVTVAGTVTSYSDTAGSAGIQYFYQVQALDSAGNASGFSVTVSASLLVPPPPVVEVKKGRLKIAPNKLDVTKPSSQVKFHLKGDPGGVTEVRIYNMAGQYMGTISVPLNAGGVGVASYDLQGVDGYIPVPGAYWALAQGGGVNDKQLFFISE